MHEFQVMRQVVKMVEDLSLKQWRVPWVVRVNKSSRSHFADHCSQDLATTFAIATQGTTVQGTKLEIFFIPVKRNCQNCGVSVVWSTSTWVGEECRSGNIVWEDHPEVVLTEVEFRDISPLQESKLGGKDYFKENW